MPYHTKNSGYKNVNSSAVRMPKPLYRPRKDLSKLQKDLMKAHKVHHTPAHMKMMKNLMLKGYCFQQAHAISIKKIGR